MAELRDARDEAEAYHGLACFQRLVELLHHAPELGQHLLLVKHIQQRRIVLVDDDGHLFARALVGSAYHARKQLAGKILVVFLPELFSQRLHHEKQGLTQFICREPVFGPTHIQMNNGILLPLRLQVHDLQAFEKLLLAFEIGVQRGGKQRLAEPTRTAEEDKRALLGHSPDQIGLVDIEVVLFP